MENPATAENVAPIASDAERRRLPVSRMRREAMNYPI
jgi:hypothetical protein